ncbi:MAG TPA: hypothetical protein VE967_09690 [Gemmatimonadaceae bacterium]|nr:hypothetical protein [Gemmatimonadaceae bacterium]
MADKNWMFIGAAYVITWTVLLVFLARVTRGVKRAREEYAAQTKPESAT